MSDDRMVFCNVKPPGETDVYHNSRYCAGDFTIQATRSEVGDQAHPCGNCITMEEGEHV